MNEFSLQIVTPEKIYASMQANQISFSTKSGVIALLAHHADLIANVEIAAVVVLSNGRKFTYACSGGEMYFDHKNNSAKLYVHSIERADEINIERAIKAKEEAERIIADMADQIAVKKAEIKLKRALLRIAVKNKEN